MKKFILISLIICFPSFLSAQENGFVSLEGRAACSQTFGAYGAALLSSEACILDCAEVAGALLYAGYGRLTADVRPSYFKDFPFGRVKVGAIACWSYQNTSNEINVGVGAGVRLRWLWADLGYYYRILTAPGGGSVKEPYNLYYELGFSCLPGQERWDLSAIISNSRLARLERPWQPGLTVEGVFYPCPKVGISLSADYMKAGIFGVSSSTYQYDCSLGVRFRW